MRRSLRILTLACVCASLTGCMSIAEYQKVYLNDKDMILSDDAIQTFESNFHTYREGAAGANGGKAGGGCGCN